METQPDTAFVLSYSSARYGYGIKGVFFDRKVAEHFVSTMKSEKALATDYRITEIPLDCYLRATEVHYGGESV